MSQKLIIEKVVRECLNAYLRENVVGVNESLNNFDAPLYHNTDMTYLLQMMGSNSISGGHHRGYGKDGTHNGICFTRNKNYNPYTYYCVRMTFGVRELLQSTRGLKLVSYQDPEWDGLDEYEERLISKNGKPFEIANLNEVVMDVAIVLDTLCNEIIESGEEYEPYIDDLKDVVSNNIFGNKLRIVKNLKDNKSMSLQDAINYITSECKEEENDGEPHDVYCVEYFDYDEYVWYYSEYTQNRTEALRSAEDMHYENDTPTRVTYGKYDGIDYEMESVVEQFGEVE